MLGSEGGSEDCYTRLNVDGDQFGNCGYSGGAFVPCPPEHAQCGQLQCTEGEFVRGDVGGFLSILRTSLGGGETCRSFTSQPSSDTPSPGLVADGTRCGNGSVRTVWSQSFI